MALILYFIAIAIYLIYKWSISTYDYFEKQGIPFRKPIPFLGTNSNMVTRKKAFTDSFTDSYNEFKHEKWKAAN